MTWGACLYQKVVTVYSQINPNEMYATKNMTTVGVVGDFADIF